MAAVCALMLAGCGSASAVPTLTESDNPYASYTPTQFTEITQDDLDAKGICYEFEGSYTEGFQTLVEPTYMTLYMYDDGLMYGVFDGALTTDATGSPSYYYGYWYNQDEYGDECLNMVFTAKDGGDFSAETSAMAYTSSNYQYQAALPFEPFGDGSVRTILLYGNPYTPDAEG